MTRETRVDAVDKSLASEIQTEADNSNVSERPHSDKRILHVCTVCDKRFVRRGSLNDHRKCHSGEHVYLCSECEKRFSSRAQQQPLQMNDFATFDMLPFIPLHFLCTHFWHLLHCIELSGDRYTVVISYCIL